MNFRIHKGNGKVHCAWSTLQTKAIFRFIWAFKTLSASQNDSHPKLLCLNGYPIPPKLQQVDMLMLSKRLNGSASKITIGSHALEYDFMDNDAESRMAGHLPKRVVDAPTGVPAAIPLRFWRGESKHADQLIQTHLESSIHPLSVMMFTHQRFLAASIRGEKALTSTTWKQFAKTRAWMDEVPFPQMLELIQSV